jgi:hypothetical protein
MVPGSVYTRVYRGAQHLLKYHTNVENRVQNRCDAGTYVVFTAVFTYYY